MNTPARAKTKEPIFHSALLKWYDHHARSMPWRVMPDESLAGIRPDPYRVWLSEIMLQQTQVATVHAYFLRFIAKWPDVTTLAASDLDEVMKSWAGLGYYSRARNLKKCAEIIANEYDGEFPQTLEALKKLPGIGEYTAAAICAIAFNKPVAVIDGNVERVIARLKRIDKPPKKAKTQFRQITYSVLSKQRPGDFAQAMMDLGAVICTPKNPSCKQCPVNAHCSAFANDEMELYPVKTPKPVKPIRKGAAFVMVRPDGGIFLQKRKPDGLLGGMSAVPGTNWNARQDGAIGVEAAPFKSKWQKSGLVKHTFTHFHLELEVWTTMTSKVSLNGWWSTPSQIANEALPSVMRKVIQTAIADDNSTRHS